MSNDELVELIMQYIQSGREQSMECQEGHRNIAINLIDVPPEHVVAIISAIGAASLKMQKASQNVISMAEWKNSH